MNSIIHPSLVWLYKQNATAKIKKAFRSLKSPRRIAVTTVAAVLGCVWLSQVVASVFLRQAADPEMLRERIALGLMGFLGFQVLKILYRKPVEPFEWTPSETQILKTAPISRSSLVLYRFASTAISATLKSVCFVLVMIPDLTYLAAGFVGMAMALLFLELVRTVAEVVIYSVGKRRLLPVKIVVSVMVLGVFAAATLAVVNQPGVNEKLSSPAAYQFLLAVGLAVANFTTSGIGGVLAFPFRMFTDVILTTELNSLLLYRSLLGAGFVAVAGYVALVASCSMVTALQTQDRLNLTRLRGKGQSQVSTLNSRSKQVSVPKLFSGIGVIAWRQFHSAWNYRASLVVSFLIPTALCCVPMFARTPPPNAALFLVASLLFYSYLLLPAALMLDFRRDVDRMAVLKKLPIKPINVVLGQLAAPVVLCSLFQAVVFLIAAFSGIATAGFLFVCWLAIVPMNVLIFSSENIIFMLHPYRRNKEGADVLIRSMLTFTGKGMVWALSLTALLLWALTSSHLVRQLGWSGSTHTIAVASVFLTGTTTAVSLLALLSIRCLTGMFERFDPGSDRVAMN